MKKSVIQPTFNWKIIPYPSCMKSLRIAFIQRLRDAAIKSINRFLDFIFQASPHEVLNDYPYSQPPEKPAEALREAANRLLVIGLTQTGQIDYSKVADSSEYKRYQSLAASLQGFDPASLASTEEQLAFWINLYNALILDAVIRFQVRGSITNSFWIFRRAAYNINGLRFSADDIEHGILRNNRPNPMLPLPPFPSDDERQEYCLQEVDPRIHFALVCAARSCPPIAVYQTCRLHYQLDRAADNFINGGGVQFEAGSSMLYLSQIFRWYQVDFDGREAMLDFVRRYLQDADALEALQAAKRHIRYLRYDWKLNGTPAHSQA